jgi:hypothetical protein
MYNSGSYDFMGVPNIYMLTASSTERLIDVELIPRAGVNAAIYKIEQETVNESVTR